MTEHKTMNTIIHAAFRRDLARFVKALGAFPAGSRERAGQLGDAWQNFSHQLHQHHQDEETIFWPALRQLGANEAMVGDLGGEHERMLSALEVADSAMSTLRSEPTAESATAAHGAVSTLRSVLEEHLEHEERDLEPFAAAQLGTAPMQSAMKAVRKAHKGNAGTFAAWLQDGADADAVSALRRTVPPPVLFVMTKIGGRDYHRRIAPVWT